MVTAFLQSMVQDPYEIYETMLANDPVCWNDTSQHWALYSYQSCKTVLSSTAAHIPVLNPDNKDGLNEYALTMTSRFVRLRNGTDHELAREAATLMFAERTTVSIPEIIKQLLENNNETDGIDWVHLICKKLPVIVVLKSFRFSEKDCDFIGDKIEKLVKIMLPGKTAAATAAINEVSKAVYLITENHLLSTNAYNAIIKTLAEKYPQDALPKTNIEKIIAVCVSNLIGLAIIQGYDANRGLLSNSLLQVLDKRSVWPGNVTDATYLRNMVIETVRFDPPVHNTKRIAIDDIVLKDAVIKKGETIFIVLAAANRDARQFANPNIFDIRRTNNNEHLTFGLGSHACPASQFSVNLVIQTLLYFFERYKKIQLVERNIQYEPLINMRLPKQILIAIS